MLLRLFKYSIKNILRNKFLSISSVLVLSLLMFFINVLMILHNLSNHLIDAVNSKLTLSLYLKDEFPRENADVQKLMDNITQKLPNIKVVYKSKDEVLQEMREKDEELVKIIQGQNPLPATINISEIQMKQYEELNNIIESKMYLLSDFHTNVTYDYRTQYERIIKIIGILQTLKGALYAIILIFLGSIFVITYSIIGNFIYHYRDEIHITKLVGGNNSFIYGPFVFQGMIYSLLGFFLSTNVFILVVNNIKFLFDKNLLENLIMNNNLYLLLSIQCVLFLFIGAMSAYLSSRRYIKN